MSSVGLATAVIRRKFSLMWPMEWTGHSELSVARR